MEIRFRSEALLQICESRARAEKAWGPLAQILRRRLDDLHAARDLKDFLSLPHIRHRLVGTTVHILVHQELTLVLEGGPIAASSRPVAKASPPVVVTEIEVCNAARKKA